MQLRERRPIRSDVQRKEAQLSADAGSPTRRARNNLNLCRLILASLVIVSHAPELKDGNRAHELLTQWCHTISFGELAVDGFFLLSGFLVIQSWFHEPVFWQFMKKRALRIYPAFIVASVICAFIVGPLGDEPRTYFSHFNFIVFLKDTLTLAGGNVADTFKGCPYPYVDGAMRTIHYEFACYILVGVCGLAGLLRRSWFVPLLAGCSLTANLLPGITDHIHFHVPKTQLGFDGADLVRFVSFFFTGGTLYVLRQRFAYKLVWSCAFAVVSILALFNPIAIKLLLPTLGGYALLHFGLSEPLFPFQRSLEKTDLSYGIYLYAWPIQMLIYWYFPSTFVWTAAIMVLVLSGLCGFASWSLIERPALRWKTR